MKLLILTLLLTTPALSQAIETTDNITCALDKVKVEGKSTAPGNARNVIVFKKIGSNVYERKNYSSPRYNSTYQASHRGHGKLFRLIERENGERLLGNAVLSDDMILRVDVSTGSYPGAGTSPRRENEFKCLYNYLNIEGVTRRQVFEDFELEK